MPQEYPPTNYQPDDLPLIGGFISKIGKVRRIQAEECEPGAAIAVLAFWHSAPLIVWSLFGPDCIDLFDERRGRSHKRRRIQVFKDGHIIRATQNVRGWGWAIFRIGDLAQRASWYFAVADAGTDLIVNWMSLAMKFSGCAGGGGPYGMLRQEPGDNVLIATSSWLPLAWLHAFDHIFNAGGASIAIPPNYTYASYMTGSIETYPGLDPPAGFQYAVTVGSGDTVFEGTGDWDEPTGSLKFGGFFQSGILNPGVTLTTYYKLEKLGIARGDWNVAGIKTGAGITPFGCSTVTEKGIRPGDTLQSWWDAWLAS
jgi:hypothetical protein